jgi:magnesium transporter
MPAEEEQRPWEELGKLAQESDADGLEAFLDALPPGEAARALSRLSDEDQARLMIRLDPEDAADLVEQIPDAQAVELIEGLEPQVAAAIVDEMPSDEQADLLGDLEREDAEAILAAMDPAEARDARLLSRYPDDVAGGLMITEYLIYPQDRTVGEVVHDIRLNADRYRDYEVQYTYVTEDGGVLVGVLNQHALLLGGEHTPVHTLMIRDPVAVRDTASLDELRDLFDKHHFLAVPVVDAARHVLGVVRAAVVEEALAERGDSDYRQSQGIVGGDELRTMPLLTRALRRLSWLSVNILLNIVAASVIAFYQDTLAAVIALAVFLPIISDMSGCSGNQAVAVSIRELALGLVRPTELLRVWSGEVLVGIINGTALGALIAAVAWLWKGSPLLGLVAGAALAANTVVAVSVGGLVPLALKRLKVDPALASGPILTTITDMCGFFLVLSLASALLPWLTTG